MARLKVYNGSTWEHIAPAGAAASAFRLSGVKDGPTDLALGSLGDEFEYPNDSAFAAVWTPTNSLTDWNRCASAIRFCSGATNGRGFYRDAGGNLPDDFEVAVFITAQGRGNMTGIAVLDSSGNGIGCSPYNPTYGYTWDIASYAYSATRSTGTTNPTGAEFHTGIWVALRRLTATSWRFRWSPDGTTWTTCVAADTKTVTNARRIFIGNMFNNDDDYMDSYIHRVVYGTNDLGLG